uniref:RING-type domain-containing protein n=1 Tax=viral metagenome TaxID=1070528 RepID=A0A6C0CSW7_9ZZZZ
MSERDFYGRRLNRLNLLNNNDRFILNIYLEMYNQTIHDINMMYQDIDLMYENISELRNIINSITGVSDVIDERDRDRNRERVRIRSRNDESENTRRQRRRTDNSETLYDNIHDIFHSTNRPTGYNRRTTTIPNIFQHFYGQQTNHRTNALPTRGGGLGLGDFLLNFYDTVPVYPTRVQINNGTRRVLYSNIENPLNSSCPITLENFDDADNVTQILGCGHIFNHESLNSWFRNHVRCPVCRYDIRNYVPRSQPLIQEINTSRRTSPVRDQDGDNGEETKEENNNEETPVNNSMDDTQSSGGTTLHTATNDETSEQPDPQGELMDNLTNITENLIHTLLNNNRQSGTSGLYNEIVYNLPYIDPSSNDIVFEGYIQNNYRM